MILRKLISYASLLLLVCAFAVLGASTATAQCVNLTGGTYTQNFDTLANTGTSSALPTGWFLSESGTNANTTYTAGTGSGNAGDTYSFGASGSTNRALGGLLSGSLTPTFGACFTNNTGSDLSAITVQYLGKQFRLGTANRGADRIDFQYSTDATSLATGTWTNVDLLDFSSQITTGTVGAVTASAQVGPQVVSGFSLSNGATIWIRWTDFNASGADDGLAVDDFSLTAGGTPASTNPTATGSATATTAGGSTTFSGTITPGTNPDSISYTVSCDLTSVGGSNSYALSASGTTISGMYTVPGGVAANTYSLPCSVADDQMRSSSFSISLTISAQSLTIMQIQGSGSRSPHEGESVQTSGVVYDVSFNGYWIQDSDGDLNPNTSDGVFVFTSSTPSGIAKGDLVNVAGKVSEFSASGDPSASPMTEIVQPSATVISHGNAIPDPVTITANDIDPNGGIDQLERYEGMRVHIDTLNVIAPTSGTVSEANATASSNGVFFGVIPGVPRPFRKAGIELPATAPAGSPCCIPFWNGAPQRIRVDTDVISAALGQGLNLTSGAVVSNLTGPLDFSQHAYTVVTETLPVIDSGNISAIPVPTPADSEFTVASFNMQRFFDTTNDPNTSDTVLTATAFANRLNKASLAIRNVMMTPDVIGVEEMENLSTLQAVAAKVNADAVAAGQPNPGYTGYLVEGNDIGGIDVGFLVKSRVNVISVVQYGKDTMFTEPGGGDALLNDRPPLVLTASIGTGGHITPFTVMVVHQRSLSGVDDPADGPRVREKRRVQAEYLANLIQQFQAGDPNLKLITVGDFNAFEVNDGYVDVMGTVNGAPTPADQVVLASPDLVDPNLIDLATTLPADQRYSYINYGTSQTLDHAVVNPGMMSIFSRFSYARNDADFPETYRSDPNRPERISDHDMEVAYFIANHAPTVNAGQSFTLGMGQVSVVGTVTGNDADGDALSNWQITGGDGASYFAIDPATGQITVPNPGALDTSRTTPYSLLVTVSDGSATSDPTLVTINPAPIVAGTVNLVATATLSKQGGSYVATVKVSNRGTGTAQNVVLGGATLGTANGSPVPQSLVNIPPGGYAITTVTFPASAGASGAGVIERYSGTYSGGSFLSSIRAVLP